MVYEISADEFRDFLEVYMQWENNRLAKEGREPGVLAFCPLPEPIAGEPDEGAIMFATEHGSMKGMISLYSARMNFQKVMSTAENPEAIEPGNIFRNDIFQILEEQGREVRKEETLEEKGNELLDNPETALNCLYPEVCNTKENQIFLKNVPHREILDLSVYYAVYFQVEAECGKLDYEDVSRKTGRVVLTNSLIARWEHLLKNEVPEEVLYRRAFPNAVEAHRTCDPAFGFYGMDLIFVQEPQPGNLYVSTNAFKYYGGADAFLGIGLERIAEVNQADLYIAPTSVHESILVPASEGIGPEDVAGICMGDGPFSPSEKEWLSNNVYCYDCKTKNIQIAYDAEAVKKERMDGMDLPFGLSYGMKTPHRKR